ncbi:MAG: sigma 54-interacting transcriptional regulator [Candidatus Latescibacteria bacterium]|jgi:DNA-binding NtrC family response regulator|nr:sigma 54-interacting transcriptional regulator [Candidatus Latescibacterota bacterium]
MDMRRAPSPTARETREGYFEQAHGGTLFLDEIGDMDPDMQSGLLRTLETRHIRRVGGADEIPVDVRVVSATNRDLPEAIASGGFREELYYRLNAFTIHLPPLRERPEDVAPLAEHFLEDVLHKLHKPVEGFTQAAIARLEAHSYPGNVRELKNTIEHAVILCQERRIAPGDLEFAPSAGSPGAAGRGGRRSRALSLENALERIPDGDLELSAMEEGAIREALRRSGGSQSQAASLLGLSRFALRRRLAQYEIESDGSLGEGRG